MGVLGEEYLYQKIYGCTQAGIFKSLKNSEASCPEIIMDRAICIDGDIGQVLEEYNGFLYHKNE